jgi:hypothetical protein
MSSPRVSFPTALLGLVALCGAAWPALAALWSRASWDELGDREVTVWGPVERERDGKVEQYRTITQWLVDVLGLVDVSTDDVEVAREKARRRVDRWLAELQAASLIIERDGRRVVLAPVTNDRTGDKNVRLEPVKNDPEPDKDVRDPVKNDPEPDKNVRPSVLILPNLASKKEKQDAREASHEDAIEATIAWCRRPADREAMTDGEASARDALALAASTSEAWCSALRVCMRDGLTRAEVERIVEAHSRQTAAARRAGTLQAEQTASAIKAGPVGIPAPSKLWSQWSKCVEWRAAALGHAVERKPAQASSRASSGSGRNAAALAAMRAELGEREP